MTTTITTKDEQTIISIEGRLDTQNVGIFEQEIAEVFKLELPNLIIICDKLTYISSSGLRIFLTLQKFVISKRGKLFLSQMQPSIKEIFDMTGFSSIFTFQQ